MVEGIVAPFIELIAVIFSTVVEICIRIVVASVRPWRYLLSPSYRKKVMAQLEERSGLYRIAYLFGGTAAILGSILVLYFVVRFFFPQQEPTVSERAMRTIEQTLEHRN